MHYIYYNLTYWPCLKTWQGLLPGKPVASKPCICVRVKIQAFSIYMRSSQKDHDWGNLRKVVHCEGASAGPAWPKHPSLTIHRASILNRLWWRYLEPKHKPGCISCQTTAAAWKVWLTSDCGPPVRFTKPPPGEWLCCFLQNIFVALLSARCLSGE